MLVKILKIRSIINVFYVYIFTNLKDQYTKLEKIMNTYNSSLEVLEESVKNFDESLETINMYYHKRYIEGIVDYGPITQLKWLNTIPGDKNEEKDEQQGFAEEI